MSRRILTLVPLLLSLGLSLAAGCETEPPAICSSTPTETWIVRELSFVRAEGRIADGFDLDGRVAGTCRIPDFTAPDGRVGIDNQLADLLPLIESQLGGLALDSLVQGAINNGQILLALELDGVDDRTSDGCVGVRFRRLSGTPLVGTDGYLLSGQTLYPDPDPDAPVSFVEGAEIDGGVLHAGPLDLALPVAILNANFVLDIDEALIRAEIDEEAGTMTAFVGGGVTTAQLIDVMRRTEGVPLDVLDLAEGLLRMRADLAPNEEGRCQQFSAVMELHAVRGFVGAAE